MAGPAAPALVVIAAGVVVVVAVVVALITLLALIIWLPLQPLQRASLRRLSARATPPPASPDRQPAPFEGLPRLGSVGPLGDLSPAADVDSTGTDEDDLYGV